MKKSILRDLVLLLVIFGFIWGVVSFFPIFPTKVKLLSIEKEQELGEDYLDLLLKTPGFGELESKYVDSVVQKIGYHLKDALSETEYEYHFVIIKDQMINAFTIPGGNILITTGIIKFCDSAEELASVIAHEMGHVEKRHVISRLVKEFGITILTGGDQFVMGEVVRMISSTSFDRKQERDADQFSCELLEAAKIEPRTLATFFRKLKEEKDYSLLENFEIVFTHPNFSSRIRQAFEYTPDKDFEAVPMGIDWEVVKYKIGGE